MSESYKYQWGIIFILYLVPSAIWILWLLGEAQRENKRAEALLAVVMVALIALYQAEFPPGFGAILSSGTCVS